MTYKRIVILILALAMIALIAGCRANTESEGEITEEPDMETGTLDDGMRETLIYYQTDSGYLVPVMRRIPWEEGIAKAAIRRTMNTPDNQMDMLDMGLQALLPAEASINGMSINDTGLATLDLNAACMNYTDALRESNMVRGVVDMLTEFPAIDRVQFVFDGETKEELPYGTRVGNPIEHCDLNPEIGEDADVGGAKVTVFFHTAGLSQFDYLVPVTRYTSTDAASIETAITELLRGPKDSTQLALAVPDGTVLNEVRTDSDGVTFIDFSNQFNALEDSPYAESMVMRSIMMTAKAFPGVTDVRVTVDGKDYPGSDFYSIPTFANEY
jgi:germination protein M